MDYLSQHVNSANPDPEYLKGEIMTYSSLCLQIRCLHNVSVWHQRAFDKSLVKEWKRTKGSSSMGERAYTSSPSDFSVVHKFLLLSNPLNVSVPEDSLLRSFLFCSLWRLLLIDFLDNVSHEHNSLLIVY